MFSVRMRSSPSELAERSSMSRSFRRSQELFQEAKQLIPGGVNSPVRAFGSVGGEPLFIERGEGAYIQDVDGNRYIDFVGSWGPMILGHAHPEVVDVVKKTAEKGFSFGAPTAGESQLARKVMELMPSLEMVRFVSSGTEACMSALRLARGYTGREKIIKFTGCYHGHADMLLVKAGSGVATLGIPGSPGVPEGAVKDTLVAPFNDLSAVRELFQANPKSIAAVIIEPIVGNAGFIRPVAGFLEGLRDICTEFGALFIFDEVMTGFRVGLGGVQALHGIKPDITTLGKVIGGGMPIAAYGGRRDIMAKVAPSGPIYQAGTLSGNPLAVQCGLKTLDLLQNKYSFKSLAATTQRFMNGLAEAAKAKGLPFVTDCEGGMFGFFFHDRKVTSYEEAAHCHKERFNRFFWGMLQRGVYLAPSAFEAGFVSMVHGDAEIDGALQAARHVMAELN